MTFDRVGALNQYIGTNVVFLTNAAIFMDRPYALYDTQ